MSAAIVMLQPAVRPAAAADYVGVACNPSISWGGNGDSSSGADTGAGLYVGGNLILDGAVSEIEGITVVKGDADFTRTDRSVKFGKAWRGSGYSTGADAAALNVQGNTRIANKWHYNSFQSDRPLYGGHGR